MITRTHKTSTLHRLAIYSDCERYRYLLEIVWNPGGNLLQVIGLNPSTATEKQDDPTVTRCRNYAARWGYGGLLMTNLFGFRATNPEVMKSFGEPVGGDNFKTVLDQADRAGKILVAWGNHGTHKGMSKAMTRLLETDHADKVFCLQINEKTGEPKHPLYCRADLEPVPFWTRNELSHVG